MLNLFNFLGRLVGVVFFIGGSFMGIYGLTHSNQDNPWFMILLAFIVAVLGLLLIFARPYKPNRNDN